MPITEPVWVISETPARAMPKSVTVALPSASTITFWGLRSRWTTPWRWAKRAPSSTWRIRPTACSGVSPASISCFSERPSQVLHRDVVGAVDLAAVEDGDDVGVLEAGRRLGLAAEALDEFAVLGEAACAGP